MIKEIELSKIKENYNNPRTVNKLRFLKLKKSILNFPEMLSIRPIVVDENLIILGGNMRYKAAKELGFKTIHIQIAKDLTQKQKEEFAIKDNEHFGEWDWDILANEWDRESLEDWGLEGFPFEDVKEIEEEYTLEDNISLKVVLETEEQKDNLAEELKKRGFKIK